MEKGVRPGGEEGDDEIVQMVAELTVQKEYLRARLTELREETGDSRPEDSSLLREEIRTLNEEIRERKEAHRAAEDDLAKLRSSHSELESRASDISSQLGEALQKIEHETRARDDKYADLDSKFQRLHKRAKQKIQEIQKEKDDMEARLQEVQEKSEEDRRELEVTLQQANETLRSVDLEKQQLRTANSKLRENMDELCRALEAKQNSFEELQQSLMKKEQLLEETQKLLHAAEDKKQAMISDLSSKHQKIVESLQAQLAEALSERSKATETTASLQALIIEKDSRIAELDAASTGEIARLRAAVESAKQELNHLKNDHEREIESWEATCQTLRNKLEASESSRLSFEIEAAKTKSQLELELSLLNQTLNSREADLAGAKEEISRLDSEFSSYKVRAHALLQKKDAELAAARDHELIKAHEEAVKDAEREAAVALSERNNALCDLQDALVKYDNDIAARDGALAEAHQRIKSFSMKVNSLSIQHQSEKELWQKNLQDLEESWNLRYRALEAQASMHDVNDLRNQLEELRLKHRKLKEEHKSFCDISDHTMEEKEKEIMRLKEENGNLSRSLEQQRQRVGDGSFGAVNLQKQQDPQGSSLAAADQQILLLARQQAQREEELTQSQRHILALQEEIEELERENRLHSQQEAMLKEELRNVERKHKREGVDMTYLKNVILKLLETGEVEALLPVVGMLLQFSPEEMRKCQQVYSSTGTAATAAPLATSAEVAATPRSLFSRFTFS